MKPKIRNNEISHLNTLFKDPALPIHISGFLDLFGVSMILPLILSHCRELGASPTVTGILGSTYGAIQLVSSPLIGQWSDQLGRRFVLLVCLLLSGCGYCMLALATSVAVMFAARIPLGIFKHSQSVGKAYLADISSGLEHTRVLGNFNGASSIGFILGPAVAGHIAERPGGFYLVALFSGILFIINAGIILMFVPESTRKLTEEMRRSYSSSVSLKKLQSDELNFNAQGFWSAVRNLDWADLWDLYLIKFLLGASVITFRSNFSLMLIEKFDTTPKMIGYIISFNSTISAFIGFATGNIAKWYGNNARLLTHLAVLEVLTLLALSLAPSLWIFVACLVPLGILTTVARVAGVSLTIERGSASEIGILMGFQQSCMSLARMLAPLVAGLAQEVTATGPGIVGAGLSMVAVCILLIRPQDSTTRRKRYEKPHSS